MGHENECADRTDESHEPATALEIEWGDSPSPYLVLFNAIDKYQRKLDNGLESNRIT
jgi:hypothetical protein